MKKHDNKGDTQDLNLGDDANNPVSCLDHNSRRCEIKTREESGYGMVQEFRDIRNQKLCHKTLLKYPNDPARQSRSAKTDDMARWKEFRRIYDLIKFNTMTLY